MNVVGLITEYNPFHNGHLHHLIESKKITNSTYSIAVMSGHFLQRGEPAILDKWTRAKNAVDSGVDLVIEIPTLFACSSAEYFAFGAISLLNDLKIVTSVCFGSENGKIEEINNIAKLLFNNNTDFNNHISNFLKTGISYPKARELAINKILNNSNDSNNPFEFKANNILGIEYLKSLNVLNSNITPFTIKRIDAEYMSLKLEGNISSATGIRNDIFKNNNLKNINTFIPNSSKESIQKSFAENSLINLNALSDLILYKIRTSSLEYIKSIHDVSEGIEYKIKKAAEQSINYEDLLNNIISKRFTKTRIQRILIKILLDIKFEDIGICGYKKPEYARILAFNENGQKLIKKIKKETDFKLITNINKIDLNTSEKTMLELDIKATNIYNLLYKNPHMKSGGLDYLNKPYIKNNNFDYS